MNIDAEVYYSKEIQVSGSFENNKLKQLDDIIEEGIGIRVIIDGKVGFISTNNLSEKNITPLLKRAIALAKINTANNFTSFTTVSLKDDSYLSKKIVDIPKTRIFEESRELLDLTLSALRRKGINGVISGEVQKTILQIKLLNTNGVESTYQKAIIYKGVYGKSKDTPSLSCDEVTVSSEGEGKSIEEISKNFTEKLAISLNPKETGELKKQYIFHPKALGETLYFTLGRAVSGENIMRQRSFLVNKINEKIANENVTLIDWGNSKEIFSGRPFDDEGTPTRKTKILEKGVLKEVIYDIEWANRAETESTGNAHRDYKSLPHIDLNSITIPSTTSDVFKDVKNGYYIVSTTGAHTANPVTGDFGIVLVGAYLVKSGEIKKPVYGPVLATSTQRLLSAIRAIGKDIETTPIREITVNFGSTLIEF